MKNSISNILLILIGNFLLAVGVICFTIPNDILCGGLAGVAVALKPILPFLDTTDFVSVSTIVLFVIGAICLGKAFLIKSLISTICFPIFLYLLEYFLGNTILVDNRILSSILIGILSGIGIGFVFIAKSSTGGMDILAILGEKYLKIPVHIGCLILDGATVLLGITMYSLKDALIGLLSVIVTSFMIEKTVKYGNKSNLVRLNEIK